MAKRGLMLVVGATGSGKSTTLASMIDHRNQQVAGHILTIEDPIEFLFNNRKSVVNQREVGPIPSRCRSRLKNALRQAPDVILIGEIRDRETMTAALAYAQSGHLVLATLHANNSYQALSRILIFYPVEVRPTCSTTWPRPAGHRLAAAAAHGRRQPGACARGDGQHALVSELIENGDFFAVRKALEKLDGRGLADLRESIWRG